MNNLEINYINQLLKNVDEEGNIWGVDLADMQIMSKYNLGVRYYYVPLVFLVNMFGLFL